MKDVLLFIASRQQERDLHLYALEIVAGMLREHVSCYYL